MLTFADPLRRAVQVAAEETAVIHDGARYSYAEFNRRCGQLVAVLRELGIQHGDRVAILAGNCNQYLETYVGVPAGGMVVVPLNTRHAQPELEYALKDSGARVLLTDRDPGALAAAVDQVISIPDAYESHLAHAEPASLGEGVNETDLAGLFYTGGTTGLSKGVMLTHRNLIANTFNWLACAPHYPSDRTLIMAPLFHAAGSNGVLGAIWNGGCQVTLGAFDPAAALDLIETHGITETLGVPTMLAAIAEEQHARPRRTDTLRLIAHGGSPIATEVIRRTMSAFPTASMMEVYGATELSPLATVLVGEEKLVDDPRARSCGQALIGNEIHILNPAGHRVDSGEVGEVVVRGPNVMEGYWNKAEQTAAVLKDGCYWTGDLGYMDDEGYLFLVDRSKDMIVSGGENVYCTEVEEVLYQHPAVLEAAAFGVPDEKWGEAVHAVVVLRDEFAELDPSEIIDFCREHIAGYKVPKAIDVRAEPLPKSGPGKVLKRELRAPFWEGQDRGVH
ncbi:MAG: AMP-binding protein [Pseudomonadales bacterium]|nr:AMP-binding protein [Pseudomonadales bacterium]NIX09920.1 AMP-binding protein [Pseudomonadales bacterium]